VYFVTTSATTPPEIRVLLDDVPYDSAFVSAVFVASNSASLSTTLLHE